MTDHARWADHTKSVALRRVCKLRFAALALVVLAPCSATALAAVAIAKPQGHVSQHQSKPQVTWAPRGRQPLPDKAAASLVSHQPEIRPSNQAPNNFVPTKAQLRAFHAAVNPVDGKTASQENHWYAYVTGRPGLKSPSTDDLIQWVAHKWGIPEDWLRALAAFESLWHQDWNGDLATVPARWYKLYPWRARAASGQVYESMGIAQIRWLPDNSLNVGSGALRWMSTAFNLDYMGATIRYYYDGDCHWCGPGYSSGQKWASIGAWNRPQPWGGPRQQWYIAKVRRALTQRVWTLPGF